MTHNAVSLGYVYLFENEFNYVKVGYSNNPDNRAKAIEYASGVTVVKSYISPICTNFVEIERELQQRFAPYRKKGEWFDIEFATAQAALDSYFPKKTETSDIETLIPLSNQAFYANQEEYSVNARDLHAFLEVETRFNDWIQRRIKEYGFTQGVDFTILKNEYAENKGLQIIQNDYFLTLDMAKELSMVEKTLKGKEARLYFIACEKQARSNKDCFHQNQALKQELIKANPKWRKILYCYRLGLSQRNTARILGVTQECV